MSMKLKRSLFLGTILLVCLFIWIVVFQTITGSDIFSKSSTNKPKSAAEKEATSLPKQTKSTSAINVSQTVSTNQNPTSNPISEQVDTSPKPEQNSIPAQAPSDPVDSMSPIQARQEIGKLSAKFDSKDFVQAARNKDIYLMKLFLKAGMDPNVSYYDPDQNLTIPLAYAVYNEHMEGVRLLLKHGADPNAIERDGGLTMLMIATGELEIIKELINSGAQPDLNYDKFNSPLYQAVSLGRTEVAKLLLAHGADPNLTTVDTEDINGESTLIRLTPLEKAIKMRNKEMIQLLSKN
ncbi:ankyrin repeat domain-containing protein [Brevibacillus sp. RS1.1]|uniref:ankyrin repeat domain-containing protein n=1 Tax=Brevibacillus sp. RS1.1 TaxID=2738982 RepID=UPI00156A7423|nr:ankyrin repeat domain-containing protein [Brevibacillus sp. RS1.1]NRR01136.1 ankyrin repeat domain-containing protein [Brevibacillus sp. RS1.1]